MKIKTIIASLVLAGILLCETNLEVFATEVRTVDDKYKTYYNAGIAMQIDELDDAYKIQSKAQNIYWKADKTYETMYLAEDTYIRKLSPNDEAKGDEYLTFGTEVLRVGISDNGWDLIKYNDDIFFIWYEDLCEYEPARAEVIIPEEEVQVSEDVVAAAVKEDIEIVPFAESTGEYIGTFELTAYCATGNPCADGAYPQVGYTVACNDSRLWHHWIYIEGYGTFYVHDTGGMASNVIDIFMGSYDECIQFGRRSANIYYAD